MAQLLGAGVYHHYRPVLVDTIVSRGEFLTSYTPYQEEDPQLVLKAPHNTRTPRVDEVTAARKPIVRWKPPRTASLAAD